jgi:threonine/homoserine/homoserine lactone efflux protein
MDLHSLTALAIATIILGLSPGPAVFATIGRSLSTGLGATYLFITGIILGDLLFSLMAMLGLAALATHYAGLFTTLKILGGGYLIYLGFLSFKTAQQSNTIQTYTETGVKLIASGFLLTASNPKDLLFFVGFLPLFMDLKNAGIAEMSIASIVICLSFILTLSFYALVANSVRAWFKSGRAVVWLHRVAGVLMLGVGVGVILS